MPKDVKDHISFINHGQEEHIFLLSTFKRVLRITIFSNSLLVVTGFLLNWLGFSLIFAILILPCIVAHFYLKKGKLHIAHHIMSLSFGIGFLMIPIYIGKIYVLILGYLIILIIAPIIFKSKKVIATYLVLSFLGIFTYIFLCIKDTLPPLSHSLYIEAIFLFSMAIFAYQLLYLYLIPRQKILKALEERKTFLNQVLDISPNSIFTKNIKGEYTFANKHFRAAQWVGDADIIGKTHKDLFSVREYAKQIPEEDQKIIASGKPVLDAIAPIISKDEKTRWVQYSKVPIKDKNKQVVGILCITKDITEHRMANLALQEGEAKYRQKCEELEKYIASNMQLENFAYLASHDLKEPVRSIVSFSQLLQRKAADKLNVEEKEYLNFIISASKNMSTLIDDLLRYSLVDAMDQNRTSFPPTLLLEVIMLELSARINATQATVKYENLPDHIEADRTQIKQLFQNLISNALKFRNPAIPPVVTISGEKLDHFYQFSVADNGIGIAPEFHERIFLLFRRLHHKEDYEGTGIGLAICKKIVEQHGGRIWLESEVGQGTTFHFTIAH